MGICVLRNHDEEHSLCLDMCVSSQTYQLAKLTHYFSNALIMLLSLNFYQVTDALVFIFICIKSLLKFKILVMFRNVDNHLVVNTIG